MSAFAEYLFLMVILPTMVFLGTAYITDGSGLAIVAMIPALVWYVKRVENWFWE